MIVLRVIHNMKRVKVYNIDYFAFGINLMNPYEENYREKTNDLHIQFFKWSIWISLPQIIKPKMKYVDLSKASWAKENKDGTKGYWDEIRKSYGFTFLSNSIHINYGIQPMSWTAGDPENSDHTKVIWYPWNYKHHRTEVFSLDGSQRWDDTNNKLGEKESPWEAFRKLQYIVKDKETSWNCYKDFPHIFRYEIYVDKYDGKKIEARYHIVEREWRRFKLPFLKTIRRTLEIDFKEDVGPRKRSWKGGTIGMGFDMKKNESHEQAWKRFFNEYRF